MKALNATYDKKTDRVFETCLIDHLCGMASRHFEQSPCEVLGGLNEPVNLPKLLNHMIWDAKRKNKMGRKPIELGDYITNVNIKIEELKERLQGAPLGTM